MLVGNDVVDLREAVPTAKERDQRFLGRVLTPIERECIRGAARPALALWMLWAAKESLFKVVSKLEPGTLFRHANFSLKRRQLGEMQACPGAGMLELVAVHKHYGIRVLWDWNREFVHCMAAWGSPQGRLSQVAWAEEIQDEALSAREEESVHSLESRRARLLARRLLKERLAIENPEVVRMRDASSGFLPPVVMAGDRLVPGVDLSLSHDGRFVAAMISG